MSSRLAARSAAHLVLAAVAVGLLACGPSEEELMLAQLQEDLTVANATIDSLNFTVETSNLLIDEMRTRVDSLGRVEERLIQSMQRLNVEVKKWRDLASEQKRRNDQLTAEVERMKREKQTDQRTIARLRSEADSLNATLLDAPGELVDQQTDGGNGRHAAPDVDVGPVESTYATRVFAGGPPRCQGVEFASALPQPAVGASAPSPARPREPERD